MKNCYLMLLIGGITFNANSQDYIITPSQVTHDTIEAGIYSSRYIYMNHDNSSANQLTLEWELLSTTVPGDWDWSVCDYTTCYTGSISTGTMVSFGQGGSGFISVNVMAGSPGTAQFIFTVNRDSDPLDKDTLEYNFYAYALELNQLSAVNNFHLYPNPATDRLFFSNLGENSNIVFINALGSEVKESGRMRSRLK